MNFMEFLNSFLETSYWKSGKITVIVFTILFAILAFWVIHSEFINNQFTFRLQNSEAPIELTPKELPPEMLSQIIHKPDWQVTPDNFANLEIRFFQKSVKKGEPAEFTLNTEIIKISKKGIENRLNAPQVKIYAIHESKLNSQTFLTSPPIQTIGFESPSYENPNSSKILSGQTKFKFNPDQTGNWKIAVFLYETDFENARNSSWQPQTNQPNPVAVAVDDLEVSTTNAINLPSLLFALVLDFLATVFLLLSFVKIINTKKYWACLFVVWVLCAIIIWLYFKA